MRPCVAPLLALALGGCSAPGPGLGAPASPPLRILISDAILGLDPNPEVESITESVLFNVYEPLVGFDAKLGIRTMLAESWEHPRPEQWRFRLRPGVRFHDGTPLSAPLVRDALRAVQQTKDSEAAEFLSQVKEIVAVDEGTLDLITAEPRALLSSLPVVYVAKKNQAGSFPPLVGTGPYRVAGYEQGGEIRLVRSDDYWGKRPAFENVSFLPVQDSAERLAKVNRGEADIAYDVPPGLASRPMPARIVRRPGVTLYYLGLDLRESGGNPLRRKAVRLALHTAIDRERLVRETQNGMAVVGHQAAPSSIFGFNPELKAPAPDPTRARALLKEAGYPAGFPLTIDAAREVLPAAQRVAADLREIGLQAEAREGARHDVWDRAAQGRSQAFLVGWAFTSGESSEFFEYCLHTPTGSYGFFNYGPYSNPKIDAVAEQNAAILDPSDRQRRLQEAMVLVMDELPVLPLYVADDVYAVRPGLGFEARSDGEVWLPDLRLSP